MQLIIYVPSFTPQKSFMVFYGAFNTEGEATEPPEGPYNDDHDDAENHVFCAFWQAARRKKEMVDEMRYHYYGEIKSGEIVVNVCDTTHNQEGEVVKHPTDKRDFAYVEEMVPLISIEVLVFSLMTQEIDAENTERGN